MTKNTVSADGGAMPEGIASRRDFLNLSGRSAAGIAAAGLVVGLGTTDAAAAPVGAETAIAKAFPEWKRHLDAALEWDRRNNAVCDEVLAAEPPHPMILSLRPQGDMFDAARATMRQGLEHLDATQRREWCFRDPASGEWILEESVSITWLRNMVMCSHQSSATARWARACEGELARWDIERDMISARLGEPEIDEARVQAWRDFTAKSVEILMMPAETLGDVRLKAAILRNGEMNLFFNSATPEDLGDTIADDLLRLIPAGPLA